MHLGEPASESLRILKPLCDAHFMHSFEHEIEELFIVVHGDLRRLVQKPNSGSYKIDWQLSRPLLEYYSRGEIAATAISFWYFAR
jgi:hypothetical protein